MEELQLLHFILVNSSENQFTPLDLELADFNVVLDFFIQYCPCMYKVKYRHHTANVKC